MKRITDSRRLLGVNEAVELKELKTVYRNLMKDHHPDKFNDNDELKHASEEKSKKIIEAYHFLVSVNKETQLQSLPEYTQTITLSGITDYEYKGQTLLIKFSDGSSYEYLGVPKSIYVKLVNAPAPARFARRHIYSSFIYRNITKAEAAAVEVEASAS